MGYASEEDVYEETGMTSATIASLSHKTTAEVTALVLKYIDSGDKKLKRLMKVPITIRKEEHEFDRNSTVLLGPYEDSLEFFGNYDPEDCVEEVFAVYSSFKGRRKLPYPKNCDDLTENITDITANTNCALVKDTNVVKAGSASIRATFSGAGNFYFPSGANLDKRIYSWDYVAFFIKTNDKTATYTLSLTDSEGNVSTKTFTVPFNNTWSIIALKLLDFENPIDWKNINLQKITLSSNKACIINIDCFNFNDGVFWCLPEGLICWSDPTSDSIGEFEVTYSYDPYAIVIPEDLAEASAKLAAIKVIDYCLGARDRYITFKQMGGDMDKSPDKEPLEIRKSKLLSEIMAVLAGIGFGTEESIGAIV
jgi:hypothetical protein